MALTGAEAARLRGDRARARASSSSWRADADRLRHHRARGRRPAARGGGAPGVPRPIVCERPAPRSTSGSPTPPRWHGRPLVPPGLDFAGRPQLIAHRRGRGGGRSLVFNGHIDVVSARAARRVDERPVRRRGARRQALRPRLVRHEGRDRGDGVRGSSRSRRPASSWRATWSSRPTPTRSPRAPAAPRSSTTACEPTPAIVTEPTELQDLGRLPRLRVRRRQGPGPAGPRRGPHSPTGARAARSTRSRRPASCSTRSRSLRGEWAARDGLEHPFLSRPALLPTMARSGEWPVTYPARVRPDDRGHVPARRRPTSAAGAPPSAARSRAGSRAKPRPRTTGWPRTHR